MKIKYCYRYWLLILFFYAGIVSLVAADEEFIKCITMGTKDNQTHFYFNFKNSFHPKNSIHRSYLLGFEREVKSGTTKIPEDPYGLKRRQMERVIAVFDGISGEKYVGMISPGFDAFHLDTSSGPAYFVRTYNNKLVYAEGEDVDSGRIWQFYNMKYVRRFIQNQENNALQGQFYPGKRFGPPLGNEPTGIPDGYEWVFWENTKSNVQTIGKASYAICEQTTNNNAKGYLYEYGLDSKSGFSRTKI